MAEGIELPDWGKGEDIVMYAIWHIRPHSRFAGPSLSLTLQSPNLSLECPTCLPAAFDASLLYLCDLFTLATFARVDRLDTSH